MQATEQGARWMSRDGAPGQLQLIAPVGTKISPGENLQSISVVQRDAMYLLNYVPTGAGFCGLAISLPAGEKPIPTQVAHAYAEVSR